MTDEDIQNLLGGFATDTLTDRERQLLFTASLTNQELFNALADDQALQEFLSDPASRRQLLLALQPAKPGLFERLTAWMHRPAAWAVAGSVMAALVVAVAIRQPDPKPVDVARSKASAQQPAPIPKPAEPLPAPEVKRARVEEKTLRDAPRPAENFARLKDQEPAYSPAPPVPPPAAVAPQPSVMAERENRAPASPPRSELAAASPAKLKVAVLDFDSGGAQAKEADVASADVGKTASDLLGKKLDSSRYTVIDRKQVDKAMLDQNLSRRQLDASKAAEVGRSVGADAVILGRVTQGPQQATAKKSGGVVGGFRGAAPVAQSKVAAERNDVQVSAQAINTQNAVNVGVAYGQSDQTPGGGLARAVDQVASSLGQQIQQNVRAKIEGLVTDVNATILTINVGKNSGVKVGDRLEVRRGGNPIGRVVISTVKDTFSVGAFEGAGPVRAGDAVVSQ